MKKTNWTEEAIQYLKNNYSHTTAKELSIRFGCSEHAVYSKAHALNLKKDIEFVRETARINRFIEDHPAKKYQFKKGHVSENKGLKQTDFMSAEAIERSKSGRFKKGQTVWNHKQIGYERVNVEGYIEMKTAEPNVFKLKHRLVWEQFNGKIPKGYNVQFRDGNRQNCSIENLYLISRADQLKNENSMIAKYPKNIQLAMQAKGALNRQINKSIKQHESN